MDVKIFANNINHLTDARYFAAWGASWMCYNISKLSLTEISAIREWVEGPKHIINVCGIDTSESAAMLTNDAVDGYLTDSIADHNQIQSLLQREVEAFILDPEDAVDNAIAIRTVSALHTGVRSDEFYNLEGNAFDILAFIKQRLPTSIVLAGSEEEQVGFKSFDELDEILELLED